MTCWEIQTGIFRAYLQAGQSLRNPPKAHLGGTLARVRFTADDLAHTRFCPAPAPLIEAGLALREMRRSTLNGRPAGSRRLREARRNFPPEARPLLDLVPRTGLGPQFIDPKAAGLDEGLEIVRATPRPVLRADLALSWQTRADRDRKPPAWVRGLAGGDTESLEVVVRALRAFYMACVAPLWPAVLASFRADLAWRLPVLAAGGQAELFARLHPGLTWQDQAFRKEGPPRDFWLGGHGVQLMPSAFLAGAPVFAIRPPELGGNCLIYPAHAGAVWGPQGAGGAAGYGAPVGPGGLGREQAVGADGPDGYCGTASLGVLLGRTRAGVLAALQKPCGTAELAARVGISAASASEHTKALRDADLVETARCGRGVRHSLTYLGRSLLASGAGAPRPGDGGLG